jgi:outer membrane protein TolC
LNLKNQYAGALPTIGAFGTFGYQTQSPDIGGIFKTNTRLPFDSDEIGPDKWYSYSVFGINLSWNLFTGLQRSNKIQQEKLTLQKIENSFRSARAGIDLEVQTASITYENALKTLTSQRANMDLAGNVARVTRIKFEQGVGSNIEVVDAESSLRESQTNYYDALYQALIAKVDLDKALGKLDPAASQTDSK